ncbi:hypothetical protein BJ742DRAFT_742050 [Cladochytrium replicatum]|nr:hypothetical protein BJ742DRAFT_742050 [Cladochytrium replicatum]
MLAVFDARRRDVCCISPPPIIPKPISIQTRTVFVGSVTVTADTYKDHITEFEHVTTAEILEMEEHETAMLSEDDVVTLNSPTSTYCNLGSPEKQSSERRVHRFGLIWHADTEAMLGAKMQTKNASSGYRANGRCEQTNFLKQPAREESSRPVPNFPPPKQASHFKLHLSSPPENNTKARRQQGHARSKNPNNGYRVKAGTNLRKISRETSRAIGVGGRSHGQQLGIQRHKVGTGAAPNFRQLRPQPALSPQMRGYLRHEFGHPTLHAATLSRTRAGSASAPNGNSSARYAPPSRQTGANIMQQSHFAIIPGITTLATGR